MLDSFFSMADKPTEFTVEVIEKTRRRLDGEEKLKIIQDYEDNKKSISKVAFQAGVSRYAVRKILMNKNKVDEVEVSPTHSAGL